MVTAHVLLHITAFREAFVQSCLDAACGVTFPDPDTSHHLTPPVAEDGVKRRENQEHMGMIPNIFLLFCMWIFIYLFLLFALFSIKFQHSSRPVTADCITYMILIWNHYFAFGLLVSSTNYLIDVGSIAINSYFPLQ